MDGTEADRTVRIPRVLGLGLLGVGIVAAIVVLGGASDARADGLLPAPDDLLGTIGAVVDTAQAPLTAASTVVDAVVIEVVTPIAEATDHVVQQVPVVGTAVEVTIGSTPVSTVVAAVSGTVTGTIGSVNGLLDEIVDAVGPVIAPGAPERPSVDGAVALAPHPAGQNVTHSTLTSEMAHPASDRFFATQLPVSTGEGAGSALPQTPLTPVGSSGSPASGAASAGGSASAESISTGLPFALLATGCETARDDALPPSPTPQFDTSPD